ncbi:MAG TPA: acyltransferase [Verrucomicrobiae bacterium]
MDGLRALSVIAVALSHWTMYWHPKTTAFSRAAELGVETFFVISGFLITGILLDNRSEEQSSLVLKNFYCRRFLRIFPLFYLVLVIALLLDSKGLRQSWEWHFGYLSNLYFYLHGWTGQLNHFWSLAVEEQFYLVWPLLILRVSMRSLPFVLISCIFSAPIYAVYMSMFHPGANGSGAGILMPSCLGALGLGAFLAYAIRTRRAMPWITRQLFLAGLTGTVLWHTVGSPEQFAPLNRLAEDLLLGWLVFGVAQGFRGPAGWLLSWSPIAYLGKISYGLYVIHNFARPLLGGALKGLHCPEGVAKLCQERAAVAIFLYTAITVGLASFSWYFWEKPLNDLKRHFPYPPKTQPRPTLAPGENKG